MAKHRGFNLCPIGFSPGSTLDEKYKRCLIHRGTLLVEKDSIWLCPECGLEYTPDELETITGPASKFGNNKGKLLLQKNNKKTKLISENGDEIPQDDTLIIQEMQQGLRVLKYHEDKVEVMKKW